MTSAATVKLKQLVELEEIQREEQRWEEEHSRCANRISFLKKCKIIHKQLDAVAKKQHLAVKRSHETLLRRVDTLITEEQRGRLYVMQNESLRLEGILRSLEEGIREAIFSAAYDVQQRIKYFNKTVEMITKSEVSERKVTVGAERYEWLVMFQRFDGTRLSLLRQEVVEKVRTEKALKHDKAREALMRQIETTGASQQQQKLYGMSGAASEDVSPLSTSNLGGVSNSNDAFGPPSPRAPSSTRKTNGADFRRGNPVSPTASAKIVVRHSPEARGKMRKTIEDQESNRRHNISAEEEGGWFAFTRFVDFIAEREARYTRVDVNAEELAKCRARRLQVTQKQESQEREELTLLEAVTFQGFQRKFNRLKFEDSKFQETEQVRQMGHDQRLAHRYTRIALQQMAFADREKNAISDLLQVRKEETPIIVQQMIPDPAVVTADQSRERRQFAKKEEGVRRQILQEENTYIHILYAEMMAVAGDGDANAARIKAAQQRREDKEQQMVSKIQKKLESTAGKIDTAQKNSKLKIESEKLAREEMKDRVRVNQDHFDWHAMMATSLKAASRLAALQPGMLEEETRLRAKIVSHERNLRESYAQTFKASLRPKTKQPLPPLPLPPVDFEKAKAMYASIKAQSARGATKSSMRSTASSMSLSARSSNVAQTPHLPPIDNKGKKAPTRKYLSEPSEKVQPADSTREAAEAGGTPEEAVEAEVVKAAPPPEPSSPESDPHTHTETIAEKLPSVASSHHGNSQEEDIKSESGKPEHEEHSGKISRTPSASDRADTEKEIGTESHHQEETVTSKSNVTPSRSRSHSSSRSSKDSRHSSRASSSRRSANNEETKLPGNQSPAEEAEL